MLTDVKAGSYVWGARKWHRATGKEGPYQVKNPMTGKVSHAFRTKIVCHMHCSAHILKGAPVTGDPAGHALQGPICKHCEKAYAKS